MAKPSYDAITGSDWRMAIGCVQRAFDGHPNLDSLALPRFPLCYTLRVGHTSPRAVGGEGERLTTCRD